MRLLRTLLLLFFTAGLIFLLDQPLSGLPALGRLLDPVNGWAAQAEPMGQFTSQDINLEALELPATVFFEERMVPHIVAQSEHDLYFLQGYIHAYFRLWQMDFQTRAAAGRVGEVVGERMAKDPRTGKIRNAVLEFDRGQRRKGMVFGAENSLEAMEADARTKLMLDAYRDGINSFITSLKFKDLPLEYKLMGFAPEPWTNLKTALLLKYMADDLTGYTEDFALTALRDALGTEQFNFLFPERRLQSKPVIPEGTAFAPASLSRPSSPPDDSVWVHFSSKAVARLDDYETAVGSNNWVLGGVHTRTGAPILCNDPHLGLNLPSLWFEMQLQSPEMNVYGVSLPGAPGIIIGFNDSLSWGFTNNYRDVKDFYEIERLNAGQYIFDGQSKNFDKRVETIGIKGKPDFTDTVYYSLHGPIMYDPSFPDPLGTGRLFAVQWMAHRASNELAAVYLLNRARDYLAFTEAIAHFECPAQNMIYADRAGNIAIWGQGVFINKWKDQGRYVMKGNTSATLWGEKIPVAENPHVLNPAQGFLFSANQITTDTSYPYWYNGYFHDFRSDRIYELLTATAPATVEDNMNMQQDVVSELARAGMPVLETLLRPDTIARAEWQGALNADSRDATRFQVFWELFYDKLWKKDFSGTLYPSPERTLDILLNDTSVAYHSAIVQAVEQVRQNWQDSLSRLAGADSWYEAKNTRLTHLARIDAFGYQHLKIGGWGVTINAAKPTHGPSWRMVVSLDKDSIRAFGVYPGGQSGNPGSPFYGSSVSRWAEGKYYRLLFLPRNAKGAQSQTHVWTLHPKGK